MGRKEGSFALRLARVGLQEEGIGQQKQRNGEVRREWHGKLKDNGGVWFAVE